MNQEHEAIGLWFKSERKARDLTQLEVAEKLGKNTFGPVAALENRGVKYETALERAEMLGWSIPPKREILAQYGAEHATVPISSVVASMGLVLQADSDEVIEHIQISKKWLRNKTTSKNLGLLPVTGDSMEPTYSPGDTLLVDREVTSIRDDAVYVVRTDRGVHIKRVTVNPGEVTLSSDNPKHANKTYTDEEAEAIRILGRVVCAWVCRP